MDTKTFITKIKELIKIEAKNAIKTEVQQLLKENQNLKKRIMLLEQKMSKKNSPQTFKQLVSDDVTPNTKRKQEIPILSKNPVLNNILKETMEEQYKTMNFDSSNVHGWKNQIASEYDDLQMESNAQSSVDDVIFQTVDTPDFNQAINQRMTSKGITLPSVNANHMIPEDYKGRLNAEALPDFLQGALTRDYSQLVKAQSKKK